ncbi:MAG: hypothetical protein OXT65_09790 [Alphaproteobacteria bacterium]|nr:hypothetical protein [Alphaproteobacteria bacterium]
MDYYTFKEFVDDCRSVGYQLAAEFTPPVMHKVTIPVLGRVFGVTLGPVVMGAMIATDTLEDKVQVWKRSKVSAAEKSIRKTFGDISLRGYTPYDGGITMTLKEACVYDVYSDGKVSQEADVTRSDTHYNREQCAKDMLGNLARGATKYGRSMSANEERFIVVRKKGDAVSQFYKSAKIDSLADAPKGVITATHHYYNGPIGYDGISKETYYAITPVDAATAKRLRKLGL